MHSNSKVWHWFWQHFPGPLALASPGWLLPNARLAQCATAIDGAMVEFRRKVNRDPLFSPAGPTVVVVEWYTLIGCNDVFVDAHSRFFCQSCTQSSRARHRHICLLQLIAPGPTALHL